MADVRAGMSYAKAAKRNALKRSTLYDKMKKTHTKSIGRPTGLTNEEEKRFANSLEIIARWGYPIGPEDMCNIVKNYLDAMGISSPTFPNNKPGPMWVDNFCKRQRLSKRVASNIKRARAAVGSEEIVNYFNEIKEIATRLPATNIFNYDETNLCDDPGRKLSIVPTGTNRVEMIQDISKSSISIMF
uniref:uncharacterized protein LOC120327898 n=1 Tax=Styela clava TaxID=7725 RepID=UPI001939B581|nr:uncharacterized protein LOC120327898 [Styela clava]